MSEQVMISRELLGRCADNIAYAIYNLADKKLSDLRPGVIESTDPAISGLIAEIDLRAILDAQPVSAQPAGDPDECPIIDLNASSFEAIKRAAGESNWIPEQYFMNDWVSDVCAFLRGDLPALQAKAVVPDALDRAFITGESCDGVYRVVIQSETLKEMQSVHSWLASLNAPPVQLVSVPDVGDVHSALRGIDKEAG